MNQNSRRLSLKLVQKVVPCASFLVRKPGSFSNNFSGQALMEFMLVLPILVLLLFSAFFVGSAMYTGANASSAMKEPILQKSNLAVNPGDSTALAQRLIQGYQSGSFQVTGSAIDTVNIQNINNVSSILVGRKTVAMPIQGIPDFTFTTTQAINSNLLKANTANPNSIPAQIANSGNIGVNPADYGLDPASLPQTMPLSNPACSTSVYPSVNIATFNNLFTQSNPSGSGYTLNAFAPAAPPSPVVPFNPNYNAPTAVDPNFLMNIPNTSCDSSASDQLRQKNCAAASGSNSPPPACMAAMKASCRLEYASLYADQIVQNYAAAGGCNVAMLNTTTADVTFPSGQMPNY